MDVCAPRRTISDMAPEVWGDSGRSVSWATRARLMWDIGFTVCDQGLLVALGTHFWAACVALERFDPRTLGGGPVDVDDVFRGRKVAAFAMTEPTGGSQATAAGTRAAGDPLLLSGAKRYITNAGVADVAVVFATEERADGSTVPSCFLVDTAASGWCVRPHPAPRPLTSCSLGDIDLMDVAVIARIGRPGQGGFAFSTAMEYERTYIFAGLLGVAEALIARAVAALNVARRSGSKLNTYSPAPAALADLKIRAMACAALVESAARRHDAGGRDLTAAAAVKTSVSRLLLDTALTYSTISGARAAVDPAIWRHLTDARLAATYSGSDDVQHMIVARALGIREPGGLD